MITKSVNGRDYKACEKANDSDICQYCGRELRGKLVVCQRNFPAEAHGGSTDTRNDKSRLSIISDKCNGCDYFRDKGQIKEHRCIAAGCQKVSLWNRLYLKRWQCPKEKWNDIPEVPKQKWASTRALIRDTYQLIDKLPQDIDAIIGVPRSGMLPAGIIATTLHFPLYSISKHGVISCGSGNRFKDSEQDFKHALVIDDTVCRGSAMKRTKGYIDGGKHSWQYTTACIYASPGHQHHVDIACKQLDDPHYLEWNFFNSGFVRTAAFDIDGILCPDVPRGHDDDGPKYLEYLENAPVKYAIRNGVANTLITARLEKYRAVTESWLEKQGIRFRRLVMGPWQNNRERAADGEVVQYKADAYRRSRCSVFVESDDCIASRVAKLTKKPVICPATERVY